MITLRQAALEALEALLICENKDASNAMAAITALRAALAEPADTSYFQGWMLRQVLFDNGEPVAHRDPELYPVFDCPRCGHCCPQLKPLTQTEVVEGFCKQPHDVQFVSVFNAGVRFAEAAHGIKEEA